MSVSVRTRFEVFKRDRFTCAYCGQTPPKVLLEVDHVVPRAAGGSDDMENLVTSCQDCNRGKSDKLLEEGVRPAVSTVAIEELEERIAQAQAYAQLAQTMGDLLEKQLHIVVEAWARAFRAEPREVEGGTHWVLPNAYDQWPDDASIRTFLRRGLTLHAVLEAVDETAIKFGQSGYGACRYFYAICWRRIKRPGE